MMQKLSEMVLSGVSGGQFTKGVVLVTFGIVRRVDLDETWASRLDSACPRQREEGQSKANSLTFRGVLVECC